MFVQVSPSSVSAPYIVNLWELFNVHSFSVISHGGGDLLSLVVVMSAVLSRLPPLEHVGLVLSENVNFGLAWIGLQWGPIHMTKNYRPTKVAV